MGKNTCKHKIQDPITKKWHTTLTWTSDMNCYSFSLAPGPSGACPLSVVENDGNRIAGCRSCYAFANRYQYGNVMQAQYGRLRHLKYCFEQGDAGMDHVVDTLTWAIRDHVGNVGYFRWFDSGDFFSKEMIVAVTRICRNLPGIRFWAPSRTWHSKVPPAWVPLLKELAALPNMSLRPSGLYLDEPAPKVEGWASGTSVITEINKEVNGNNLCMKAILGNDCGTNNCRECWNKDGNPVSYYLHGQMGRHKIFNGMSDAIQKPRKELQQLTISGLATLRRAADPINQD